MATADEEEIQLSVPFLNTGAEYQDCARQEDSISSRKSLDDTDIRRLTGARRDAGDEQVRRLRETIKASQYTFSSYALPYHCTFHTTGDKFDAVQDLQTTRGDFYMNPSSYMPHFKLSLEQCASQRAKSKLSHSLQSSVNADCTRMHEIRANEDVSETSAVESSTTETPRNGHPGQFVLVPEEVSININYSALKAVKFLPIDAQQDKDLGALFDRSNSELPKDFRDGLIDLCNGSPLCDTPVVIELSFDVDTLAKQGVSPNPPSWSLAWIQQVNKGSFRVALRTHEFSHFKDEMAILKGLLDLQQQSSRMNPLMRFEGQVGLSKAQLKDEKLRFETPRSMVDQELSHKPKLGFHDERDVFTVLAHSNLRHIHTARRAQEDYHCQEQQLHLFHVPGAHQQSTYVGFLSTFSQGAIVPSFSEGAQVEVGFITNASGDAVQVATKPRSTHGVLQNAQKGPVQQRRKIIKNVSDDEEVGCDSDTATAESIDDAASSVQWWSGRVCTSLAFAPRNFVTIILKRPWNKDLQAYDQSIRAETISLESVDPKVVSNLIKKRIPLRIRVRHNTVVGVHVQNLLAMDDFLVQNEKEGRPLVKFNQIAKNVLVRGELSAHGEIDVYEMVRDEFPNPLLCMEGLNAPQQAAVESLQYAIGGYALMHGPSGTGKTYTLGGMAKPFLCHTQHQLVVMATPSNSAANALASTMKRVLGQLKATGRVAEHAYILRIHSKGTEAMIKQRGATQYKPTRDESRVSDTNVGELNELQHLMYDTYQGASDSKFLNIHDPRLEHFDLSLSKVMLDKAPVKRKSSKAFAVVEEDILSTLFGEALHVDDSVQATKAEVEETSDKEPSGAPQPLKDDDDAKEQPAESGEMEEYQELTNELRDATLRNAHVIIGTTYQLGRPHVVKAIESAVKVVMIDEACRERPDNMIPILRGRYSQCKGVILAGDPQQLPPTVTLTTEQDLFADQNRISLFHQLYRQGHPFSFLSIQNRMVRQISRIPRQCVYGTTFLLDGPLTATKDRPFAQLFRKVMSTVTNRKHCEVNSILIDVDHTFPANTHTEEHSGSRYNEYYLRYTINVLALLLKEATKMVNSSIHPSITALPTIGILTAYRAQHSRYLSCLQAMKLGGIDVSTVECETFDGSQGKEWNFVLGDLLVTESLGFQSEAARVNVATTRARDGEMFVSSLKAVEGVRGPRKEREWVTGVMKAFRWRWAVKVQHGAGMPVCRWVKGFGGR